MDEKINGLERRVRVLVGLVVLMGAGIVVWMIGPAGRTQEGVRVTDLQVVDGDGRVGIELSAGENGPSLRLFDREGSVRVSLEHTAEGTALYIMDGEGVTRLGAAQFAHGGGGFALHGPDSRGAAVLYLQGEGSLRFFDEGGAVTARFPPGQNP